AAATKIAETTKSEDQLQQMLFAIRDKYAALERNARLADLQRMQEDENKAQEIALDTERHMTEEVNKLNEKLEKQKQALLQQTNQAVVATLDDQLKFERDAADQVAALYETETQTKMRHLDEWMADERAELESRKVLNANTEAALLADYQAKQAA